jgi:hypothetical protein
MFDEDILFGTNLPNSLKHWAAENRPNMRVLKIAA